MSLDPALGTVVVMDTAGVLPEDNDSMWANELHPTPAGFKRIVRQAVLPAMPRTLPREDASRLAAELRACASESGPNPRVSLRAWSGSMLLHGSQPGAR